MGIKIRLAPAGKMGSSYLIEHPFVLRVTAFFILACQIQMANSLKCHQCQGEADCSIGATVKDCATAVDPDAPEDKYDQNHCLVFLNQEAITKRDCPPARILRGGGPTASEGPCIKSPRDPAKAFCVCKTDLCNSPDLKAEDWEAMS